MRSLLRASAPVVAALAVLLLAPFAAATPASESDPDCESTQPWIGYRNTMAVMENYSALGSPGGVQPCEGEHWDGQDPLRSEWDSCVGAFSTDPEGPSAGLCMQQDPNAMSGDDVTTPLGVRVSLDGTDAAYAAANVALVARVAVYADDDTVALYARDNTAGNLFATLLNPRWGWNPYISENDCDQATYQHGAMTGTPLCGRDNTAITLEHALLA